MGVDRRGRPPLLGRLGLEAPGPEDVVDVVMAVDGGGQRIVGAPRAHDVVEVVAVELAARVEHHEAVRGVDRVHGSDRDEREDAGCDLLGCPPERRPHRVLVADEVALAVPVPLGHVPNSAGLDRVTHAWGSYAWVMIARYVDVTRDGDIVTVTLDWPEKRNALAGDLMRELTEVLREVGKSDATGVILAANGPVFSAGHDFGDMKDATLDDARELLDVCTTMMNTIQEIPQPVVAKVHALATAAGCQLVASCDLAIAAESAAFAIPGGKGGVFCHTPLVAVARNLGRKRALEMALTGDVISAREGGGVGPDQPRRARRRARRRGRRPHPARDARERAVEGARQAWLLCAGRLAAGRGVRVRDRADGIDGRDARRARGDQLVPREAQAEVHAASA